VPQVQISACILNGKAGIFQYSDFCGSYQGL
jgi:hypothetical protein